MHAHARCDERNSHWEGGQKHYNFYLLICSEIPCLHKKPNIIYCGFHSAGVKSGVISQKHCNFQRHHSENLKTCILYCVRKTMKPHLLCCRSSINTSKTSRQKGKTPTSTEAYSTSIKIIYQSPFYPPI